MKVRICKRCGKQNEFNSVNCVDCGATLSVETIREIDDMNSTQEKLNEIPSKTNEFPKTITCPSCGNVNSYSSNECIKCSLDLNLIKEALVKAGKVEAADIRSSPSKPMEQQIKPEERIYYENKIENIKITNKITFIKGKSWAVHNISSVAIYPQKKLSRSCLWKGLFWFGVVLIADAILMSAVFISSIGSGDATTSGSFVGTAIAFGVIGILLAIAARRKHYIVGLNSSGRMEEALITKDIQLAEDITSAIEEAISKQ